MALTMGMDMMFALVMGTDIETRTMERIKTRRMRTIWTMCTARVNLGWKSEASFAMLCCVAPGQVVDKLGVFVKRCRLGAWRSRGGEKKQLWCPRELQKRGGGAPSRFNHGVFVTTDWNTRIRLCVRRKTVECGGFNPLSPGAVPRGWNTRKGGKGDPGIRPVPVLFRGLGLGSFLARAETCTNRVLYAYCERGTPLRRRGRPGRKLNSGVWVSASPFAWNRKMEKHLRWMGGEGGDPSAPFTAPVSKFRITLLRIVSRSSV